MFPRKRITGLLAVCIAVCFCATTVLAQNEPADSLAEPDAATDAAAKQEQLHLLEQALLNDYRRFEEKLLELAEYTRRTDPDRAQLLSDARSKSTALRIAAQMDKIAEALTPTESGDVLYGDAEARQEQLLVDLAALLKHLQSEDERDRIAAEIARIQDILKDTQRLIGQEKDVRADTERGGKAEDLQKDQQRVAEAAEKLANKIDQQDAQRQAEDGEPSDSKQTDGEEPDGESSQQSESQPQGSEKGNRPSSDEKQPDEKQPEDQPSGDKPSGEQRPSDGQESQSEQQQSQGQQQGQPPQGQQQQSQQQQQQDQQTPGREQLEQARERMQQAIEKLQQQNLDEASDEQDAAIARLEEMKAQLEEILRQLREEEQKLFLAMLEARFQRMLELQLDINNGTLKLDRIPAEERDDDRHFTRSTKLSRDESKNVTEAEKALMLLKEEGSSVAFPEAVEMMRDNMQAVRGRLERGLTADTTQLLERLIVESLEEMIFALQREMEKEDQKPQDGERPQGEQGDPSLVDALAELKMVRSLQTQINRLTKQYAQSFEGEQATEPEDLEFLQKLSVRQLRIHEATYDLSVGKNR